MVERTASSSPSVNAEEGLLWKHKNDIGRNGMGTADGEGRRGSHLRSTRETKAVMMSTATAPEEESPAPSLTPKQRQALVLLAEGGSDSEVARELGVNRHTVGAWRRDQAFASELEEQARARADELAATLKAGRQDIVGLIPQVVGVLQEALRATTAVVDGTGQVHEIPHWNGRLGAIRLLLQISGMLLPSPEEKDTRPVTIIIPPEVADLVDERLRKHGLTPAR